LIIRGINLSAWTIKNMLEKTSPIFRRIEEYKIQDKKHAQIRTLLERSFSEYPEGRSYYQQVPTFRYLVSDKKRLIGHMAVDYRAINLAEKVCTIFGIGDFCVDPDFQSKNIASHLMEMVELEAKKNGIDFLVLIAQDHGFYKKKGFKLQENTCRWLIITNQKTLGVGHRNISESLMIKEMGKKKWQPGLVDFMGTIF